MSVPPLIYCSLVVAGGNSSDIAHTNAGLTYLGRSLVCHHSNPWSTDSLKKCLSAGGSRGVKGFQGTGRALCEIMFADRFKSRVKCKAHFSH